MYSTWFPLAWEKSETHTYARKRSHTKTFNTTEKNNQNHQTHVITTWFSVLCQMLTCQRNPPPNTHTPLHVVHVVILSLSLFYVHMHMVSLCLSLPPFLLRAAISAAATHLCCEWDVGGLGVGPPSSTGRTKWHQLQSGVSHLSNRESWWDRRSNVTEESFCFPAWGSARWSNAIGPGDRGTWSPVRQRGSPEQDWRLPLARFRLHL